jgi:hypothetical protein
MINSVESVQKPLFSPRVYEKELVAEAEELKNEITKGLRNSIRSVERDTKSHYRNVHSHSRLVALSKHKAWIEKNWPKYKSFFAEPREIKPSAIQPRLELVEKQSQRDIFRIARLFWSLPYSQGYGRRLNYLLWDDANEKLIGVLGLQSPPITLPARDKKYNIPREQKIELVNQTMDAYTLGALPPYSDLLVGKLIVLAAASQEVRKDYEQRYQGRITEIEKRVLPASLIAVTTLSAFGRSSIYNRVSKGLDGEQNLWAIVSLGHCKGWGTLYFSDDLYQKMKSFHKMLFPEKPVGGFGTGPKIRQQVISRILRELGMPVSSTQHKIGREVFIIPHIDNLEEVLAGTGEKPIYNDLPFDELAVFWKERYCLPRAEKRCSLEGRETVARMLAVQDVKKLELGI